MDTDTKDANGNGCIMNNNNHKPVVMANSSLGGERAQDHVHANGKGDCDSNSLLALQRGGMSRNSDTKTRRKVQWNDKNGNKLAEVLEYEPRLFLLFSFFYFF